MKHSEYVEIAKGIGEKSLKKALIGSVLKYAPFMATGFLNPILVKLAEVLAREMIKQGELAIFFQYVDFRGDAQAKDFEAAMIYNHKMQIEGTDQEKAYAEKKLQLALSNLVIVSR